MQLKSWIKASRLGSQLYIFVPICVGQFLASGGTRAMDWTIFTLTQLIGLFDQLFIVYSNDYFDVENDKANTNPNLFSGGSRVLIDGDLKPSQLKFAYRLMGGLTLTTSAVLALYSGHWYAPAFMVVGLALMVLYSFPPFQLSYRGGGELLTTTGLALVLPTFGFYAQAGNLQVFPWILMLVFVPTQLSCAFSTALPDYAGDKATSKRTFAVLIGVAKLRPIVVALQCVAIFFLSRIVLFPKPYTIALFAILLVMISLSYLPIKSQTKPVIYVGLNIFLTTLVTLSGLYILLGL